MTNKKEQFDGDKDYDSRNIESLQRRVNDIFTVDETTPLIQNFDALSAEQMSKYTWFQIDECSLPLLTNLEPSLREKYLKFGHLPGPRRYELGRFSPGQNHLVIFTAIPAFNYVYYTEIKDFSPDFPKVQDEKINESSPILRFLELTDKSDPVPMILMEMDESSEEENVRELLKSRDVVDTLDADGGIEAGKNIVSDSGVSGAPVWTCYPGGDDAFRDAYCPNWGIDYCDRGMWIHLIRTSGSSKRRHSFTRVASCFGITNLFHYFRFANKWWIASNPGEPAQLLVQPGHIRSKHIKGTFKLRRKVDIHVATGSPTSYFRAYTSFHN